MKKGLLTFLIWILLYSITHGQKNKFILSGQYSYGISSLRGNDVISKYHYSTTGDSYGVFTLFGLSNTFSLHLSFNFERKGSEVRAPGYDPNSQQYVEATGTVKFKYFVIPLRLRTAFGNKFRYFFELGPYLGFLLKQEQHFDSYLGAPEYNEEKTDLYKKTETGVTLRIGVSRLIYDKYFLSIHINDNFGLTNISKNAGVGGGGIKTNLLTLGIGFGYCINHKAEK